MMPLGETLEGLAIESLETPVLLVDMDLLDANIARIARACQARSVGWRPHVKGNKVPELARRQIAAGAIGVTCAKLSEAEAMVAGGVRSIMIANQVVGSSKIARLIRLAARAEIVVAVDAPENCHALSLAAVAAGRVLPVVIEVNIGLNRAGVEPGTPVIQLAAIIASLPGLEFAGVMAWESQAAAIQDAARKQAEVTRAIALLTGSAAACAQAGLPARIVSCGGSGTFPYCIEQPGVTEVQAGGVVFGDLRYVKDYCLDFPIALSVLATVTSRPTPTRVIVDAGRKALGHETPSVMPGSLPQSTVRATPPRLSAEHGTVELDQPSAYPAIGDTVRFWVGNADTTINLHDEMIGVRSGLVTDTFAITGRGQIK